MWNILLQVLFFNYWFNVDAPFASAIEDREYNKLGLKPKKHHMEEEHDLTEYLLAMGHLL